MKRSVGTALVLLSLPVLSCDRDPVAPRAPGSAIPRFTQTIMVGEIAVTDLGHLGASPSRALAITDGGAVVGTSNVADGSRRGFLYTVADGRLRELGAFYEGEWLATEAVAYATEVVGAVQWADGSWRSAYYHQESPEWVSMPRLAGSVETHVAAGVGGNVVATSRLGGTTTRATLLQDPYTRVGTAIDLGTLGGESSDARDVNAAGQVVGSAQTSDGAWHAYVWQAGSMRDLTIGDATGAANAINAAGTVVGFTRAVGGMSTAVVWEGDAMTALGGLVAGAASEAMALNDGGQVVGWAANAEGARRAVLWTKQDGSWTIRELGTLGGASATAFDINYYGDVVGESETSDGETHATRWTVPTGTTGARWFPVFDERVDESIPVAVDAEGGVYGWIEKRDYYGATDPDKHAVAWPVEGGLQLLPAEILNGASPDFQWFAGYMHSDYTAGTARIWRREGTYWSPVLGKAHGVNRAGVAVGYQWWGVEGMGGDSTHAFVWTEAAGVRLLPAPVNRAADPWCAANDVNDAGTIVGTCSDQYGNRQAMVWHEPYGAYTNVGAQLGVPCTVLTRIDDAGEAIGHFCGNSGSRPFRWSEAAGLRALPLPAGVTTAYANDVNKWGDVAGTATIDGRSRGIVWVGGSDQIILLPEQFVSATAIGDAGHVAGEVEVQSIGPAAKTLRRAARLGPVVRRDGTPLPSNQSPSAVAGGPYAATTSAAVSFDASGSSDPDGESLTYWWDFGDGAGAASVTPSHQYTDAGTYTVTLEVRDPHGAVGRMTTTATITQAPGSPVAVANGPYTGTEGVAVSYSAAGSSDPEGSSLTYAWDFGDGSTATGSAVSHAYKDEGTYAVSLRVTDTDGLSSSREWTTATIANSPPVVSVIAWAVSGVRQDTLPVLPVGRGQPLSVQANFTDPGIADAPYTVVFDWGDGTSEERTDLYVKRTYSVPGIYTLTVRVVDEDGATGSASRVINVLDDLAPIADAGPRYIAYEGTAVQFDGTASRDPEGGPLTYSWSFGTGYVRLTGATPTRVFPDQMTEDGYISLADERVLLTVTDQQGLMGHTEGRMEVRNVAPTVELSPSILSPVAAAPFSLGVTYRDAGARDYPLDYTIDWGDATESTVGKFPSSGVVNGGMQATTSLPHVYTAAGTYTISASVRDKDGASGVTQLTVTVTEGERPPIVSAGGPYAANEAASVAFTSAGSLDPEGGALTYVWSFGDGTTSTSANPSKTYGDNGTYTVRLTVKDPAGLTSTATTTATIANVAPTASFSAPSSVAEAKPYVVKLSSATDVSSPDRTAGFQYAFDCGAGAGYGAWGSVTSVSCAALPDNVPSPRTVRAKVKDKDAGEREYTKAMTISDVAPVVTPLTLVSPSGVGAGTSSADPIRMKSGEALSVAGSFTDVGILDAPWAIKWVWGDGISSAGTTSTQGEVLASTHTFFKTGAFRVYLQVTDKDGKYGRSAYVYVAIDSLPVGLDVFPGTSPNVIDLDLSAHARIEVAVLSAEGLDATRLSSLRLGNGSGSEASIVSGSASQRDVNGDGLPDLVASFSRSTLVSYGDLTTSTTQLVLTGTHADGRRVRGDDAVQVVP